MGIKGDYSENNSLEWMEYKSPGCQDGRWERTQIMCEEFGSKRKVKRQC